MATKDASLSRNQSLRVLSVEDNPATRLFVRLTLEAEGYEVIEAATALDGLQLAGHVRPDVVLVDLLLPDIGGLELAERIRRVAEPRQVAIIAFTGRSRGRSGRAALGGAR